MSVKGRITWKSGKHMDFECEDLQAYKVSWFGSGGTIPEDVQFEVFDEENDDAAQTGEVEESNSGEHQDGDGGGETSETGSGDSSVESKKAEKKSKR